MNIDDVLHYFAIATHDLPKASIQWALENWDAALPRFLPLLQRCADGEDRSDDTLSALFYVVHLIGEKREASAFPVLCRLLKDEVVSEMVLGEAIAENLRGILISAYDGDPDALQDLIESASADPFVRTGALEAMTYLAAYGALSDDAMRAYMLRLFEQMQPRDESFVWSAWALSAANLGYEDFTDKVDDLCRRGFIGSTDMDLRLFNEQLRRTLDDPAGKAGLAYDRIGPFEDTIGTLSRWYEFSEQYKIDEGGAREPYATPSYLSPPVVNPNRCPCGSGKKYKKCCLV
jgi:uncharacterized protein